MLRRATLLVCCFTLALPTWARSETPATLSPGARVRVTVIGGVETWGPAAPRRSKAAASLSILDRYESGKLLAFDSTRLLLAPDPSHRDTLQIDRSRIERLELSVGHKGHGWAGAGIGLLAGGGVGALVGSQLPKGDWIDLRVAAGAAVGATAGLVLGAVIGHAAWVSDRWQTVAPESLSVADAHATIVAPRPAQALRDR